MKAIVLESNGTLVHKEVGPPQTVGSRDVLLKIASVGVCGSDIPRAFKGKAYHYPLILGHEFAATVEEVPEQSRFVPGDRVVVFPLLPNKTDPMAQIGEFGVSSGYDYFGSRRNGALAEFLSVPEENLFPLPRHVSTLHAGMVEPAAVALHGVLKLDIPSNATALVIGGGPIGVMTAQWLKIRGCGQVFIAEPDPKKIEIIGELGFVVIDPKQEDTITRLQELTDNKGVDCVVDACGIPATFIQAIEAAAVFGQIVLLGDTTEDITIRHEIVTSILRRELTLYGTWNSKPTPYGKSEWDEVLEHMDKDLIVEPLISHTPSLEEGPSLLAAMAEKQIWYNKVVFSFV